LIVFYSERPRAENSGTHSGLGLSISKQIIDAHRGKIWAENIKDSAARHRCALYCAPTVEKNLRNIDECE